MTVKKNKKFFSNLTLESGPLKYPASLAAFQFVLTHPRSVPPNTHGSVSSSLLHECALAAWRGRACVRGWSEYSTYFVNMVTSEYDSVSGVWKN